MIVARPAAQHPEVLLINPPYITLPSTHGVGHQVPLGLLMVGGALLQAGHRVTLLDAEAGHLSEAAILVAVRRLGPGAPARGRTQETVAEVF